MFIEPLSCVNDFRREGYAKKLQKTGIFQRPEKDSFVSTSDILVSQCPQTSSTDSMEDRENYFLARLVRIHGSDWEHISHQLAPIAKRTPAELRRRWARVRPLFEAPNCRRHLSTLTNKLNSTLECPSKVSPHIHFQSDRSPYPVRPQNRSIRQFNFSKDDAFPRGSFNFTDSSTLRAQNWLKQRNKATNQYPSSEYYSSPFRQSVVGKRQLDSAPRLVATRPRTDQPTFSDASALSPVPEFSAVSPHVHVLNFDTLNDASDDNVSDSLSLPCHESSPVTTPLTFSPNNDDIFAVQTPTKSISESDQQSFHLISPPSGFGYLGGASTSNLSGFMQPRRLFCSNGPLERKPSSPMDPNFTAVPSFPPKIFMSDAERSAISLNQNLSKKSLLPAVSSVETQLQPPKASNSDSIALSMAKITVWNRMAASAKATSSTKPTQPPVDPSKRRLGFPRHATSTLRQSLPFPVQNQPQLSIRRILQIGFEAKWRHFALAESRSYKNTVELARQYLASRSVDPF